MKNNINAKKNHDDPISSANIDKESLLQQYKDKGLIFVPTNLIRNINSSVLILLVEIFYRKYLGIEINPNPKKEKNYHSINILIKEGFLKKQTRQDVYTIKDFIIANHKAQYKEKQIDIINESYCEWCNIDTFILHKHHFPLPRSKGGVETVKICPNCHYSFHNIVDNDELEITDKTINIFLNL